MAKHTDEFKAFMHERMHGNQNAKGGFHSPESRQHMRELMTANPPMGGKHHTEETRAKISARLTATYRQRKEQANGTAEG